MTCLRERSKMPIVRFKHDNCSKDITSFPTYILRHFIENKNTCKIEKLSSCGDEGTFPNDKPCVLLLKDRHFCNVWVHDVMFNDIDTPSIGKKRTHELLDTKGTPRYQKLFCLRCMVSYSNYCLHVCQGCCYKCLTSTKDHMDDYSTQEVFCEDCGRSFNQQSCFESHKTMRLHGEFRSYCKFLCKLRSCDECRKEFLLVLKCHHFGKKRKLGSRNVYFSNSATSSSRSGPSKYVKCGYCSDYYVKGQHSCFLKKSDSLFGDSNKRSKTIHACNVFYYDIESRLEERVECRFQVTKLDGQCIMLQKAHVCLDMSEAETLKLTLTKKQLDCMEVVKCRSHQSTLVCVVNGGQKVCRHFCKTIDANVMISFFKWMVDDVVKPTNVHRDQKNDYVFVAHNGSAYDSQFVYRNAHMFFGSKNVNVLLHNNRMIELKVQVNTGFRMSMIYFKDSYKFRNLPLRLLLKSFDFQNELQKGFFLITSTQKSTLITKVGNCLT